MFVADSGNNRIQVFDRRTCKFIRSFGKEGTGDCKFVKPYEMVIVDDHLYVCDYGNGCVQVLKLNGEFVCCSPTDKLKNARDITWCGDRFYVTGHGCIYSFVV